MKSYGERFGRLVRVRRGIEGLTQEALAIRAFGDAERKSRISELENGRINNPQQRTIDALAVALGITPEELNCCFGSPVGSKILNIRSTPQRHIAATRRSELCRPMTAKQLRRNLAGKHLQVALDVPDIETAQQLAAIAATAGGDLIEIGDPLIKRFGMRVVEDVRTVCPNMPIVIEFASSDWIDEQIQLAYDCGADMVQIIGLANETRLRKAVQCARRLDIGLCAAVPTEIDSLRWCSMAQDAGVDVIGIIRNVDCFQCAEQVVELLETLTADIHRPVSISGGFTPQQIADMVHLPWNVVIVGSAIVRAHDPLQIITTILEITEQAHRATHGQDHKTDNKR